MCDGTY
jgi:hypothetical protein